MSSQKVEVVAGCVIRRDGKFLLVQEKKPDVYGKWNIPAGRVDEGETLEQGAIRETKEESGFDVEIISKLGVWQDTASSSVRHAYYAKIIGGELVVQPEEILDAKWADYATTRQMQANGEFRADWIFEALTVAEKGVDHDQHYVTTKVAFYNEDATKILLMDLKGTKQTQYGLPGGHLDTDETPDQAITRELHEELGLIVDQNSLIRTDFFLHDNGKVVLAYAGRLSTETQLQPSNPDKEIGVWVNRDEFVTLDLPPTYVTFGLKYWPES